jgi:hypothetical protein
VTDAQFGDEGITVTTPDDGRRLAAVLLQLADELEKG